MRHSLAILLLLASPALGQAPVPPPKPPAVVPVAVITIPAGQPLVLTAEQSVSKSPLQWSLISPKVPFEVGSLAGQPNSLLLIRNPTPGQTYRFALVALGDVPPFAFDFADVTVAGSIPPPTPPPGPGPTPPTPPPAPTPTGYAGHVHATLVFDLDDPSTALLRASSVKDDLKSLDATWYTAPTAGATSKLFSAYTAVDGLPIVYFTDPKGAILARLKSPRLEADVLAQLKKIRGTN